MSSVGCRSIPSRVISQIQVDKLLLDCLDIDLTRRPLELFPVARIVRVPQPALLGIKRRSVMAVTHPRGIDRSALQS